MTIRLPSLVALTVPALLAGCASNGAAHRSTSSTAPAAPPSALVALVRSLEVLDGLQENDTWVHVRAVEADTLIDRQANEEYVRLVLDLTVLARDLDRAHAAFDRLDDALRAEARSGERTPDAVRARVERTFRDLDWSADPPKGGPVFAQLVSVSRSLRVVVRAGRARVVDADAVSTEAGSEPLIAYLREVAAAPEINVTPLDLTPSLTHPWPHVDDVHVRIEPAAPGSSYDRFQIGAFLQALEEKSPHLRVTSIDVHLADIERERWTFNAEVVARQPHSAR